MQSPEVPKTPPSTPRVFDRSSALCRVRAKYTPIARSIAGFDAWCATRGLNHSITQRGANFVAKVKTLRQKAAEQTGAHEQMKATVWAEHLARAEREIAMRTRNDFQDVAECDMLGPAAAVSSRIKGHVAAQDAFKKVASLAFCQERLSLLGGRECEQRRLSDDEVAIVELLQCLSDDIARDANMLSRDVRALLELGLH